jgi:DNA modification methylase
MNYGIAQKLAKSAQDKAPVSGYTHNFYRYPARFSPTFASAAIRLFSKPGDIVLDPYMGGGTTVVEALLAGRFAIGADLNSLAVFVTKAKTTRLDSSEKDALHRWAERIIPQLKYNLPISCACHKPYDNRTKNMNVPRARFIKKVIGTGLDTTNNLPTDKARDFARCAVLKTTQWALDGRKTHVSLSQYRYKLQEHVFQMLEQLDAFVKTVTTQWTRFPNRILLEGDASQIDKNPLFSKDNIKADLVVTSPPYPGLHILYHRWQVNGRRETPAPYWISGCQDGQGDSYYNFGSRHQPGHNTYFETSLRTLQAIRNVLRPGAYMVQLLAFSDPQTQLPRYLSNMEAAGFKEVDFKERDNVSCNARIWRDVPSRKWHAMLQGKTSGSKEVVLVHVAN